WESADWAPGSGAVAAHRAADPALGARAPRLVWAALLLLLILSMAAALTYGPADISEAELLAVLWHKLGLGAQTLPPLREAMVWDLRVPRLIVAAAAGAGLALSGAVMQALTRNPLADPYLLGLSSGAALGAVLTLLAGAALLLPLGAFLGSLAALALA